MAIMQHLTMRTPQWSPSTSGGPTSHCDRSPTQARRCSTIACVQVSCRQKSSSRCCPPGPAPGPSIASQRAQLSAGVEWGLLGGVVSLRRHPPTCPTACLPACLPARRCNSTSTLPMPTRHAPAETSPSPNIVSLNGDGWRFQLFDRPEAVPPHFSAADFDAAQWPQASAGPPRWSR